MTEKNTEQRVYRFTDICLISADVQSMVRFYETVFAVTAAEDSDDMHSGVNVGGLNIRIDSARLSESDTFYYVSERSSDNTIIGFDVEDVDDEYERLLGLGVQILNQPTTHPWGVRSFQLKDPDGNILNFRSFPKTV